MWVDDEKWGRYAAYPVIDLNKLDNHSVFTIKRNPRVYVTRQIVEALQAGGCIAGTKFYLVRQRTEIGRCVEHH